MLSNQIEYKAAYNGEMRTGLPFLKKGFEFSQHRGKSEDDKIVKLSKEQKSILIGTILGDAYLQKTGKRNARLRFEHGADQKKYLLWKISKFPKLFQGKPKYVERMHPLTGKMYEYWRHQSNSTPELGKWHALFYTDGAKHIPEELVQLTKDSLSWAVWYMDDGYYYSRDKVSYLYLGRITRHEAEIVRMALEKNLGILTKILNKKQKGFALYFSPKETMMFHKKIKDFVLPVLSYKLRQ